MPCTGRQPRQVTIPPHWHGLWSNEALECHTEHPSRLGTTGHRELLWPLLHPPRWGPCMWALPLGRLLRSASKTRSPPISIPSRRQEVVRPSNLPFKALHALALVYCLAFLPVVTSLFSFFPQNARLHAALLQSYPSGPPFTQSLLHSH